MPTKSSYHHRNLRETVVKTGLELLAEKGASQLSLREVAKRAGVSHAAPYRHFRDKKQLLEALAVDGFIRLSKSISLAMKKHGDDPRKQLFESGLAYIEQALRHPEVMQIMFGSIIPNQHKSEVLQQAGKNTFSLLVHIIENGQREKVFAPGFPITRAMTAWAAVHGFATLIIAGNLKDYYNSKKDLRNLARNLCEQIVEGM